MGEMLVGWLVCFGLLSMDLRVIAARLWLNVDAVDGSGLKVLGILAFGFA